MSFPNRWWIVRLALAALIAMAAGTSHAASWPAHPAGLTLPPPLSIARCTAPISHATNSITTDMVVATCPLTLGGAGSLLILADGALDADWGNFAVTNGNTEVRIRILVDGVVVLTQDADWLSFGGRIAVPVTAGAHTVTLSAARTQGQASVDLLGNLTVLGIPTARTDMKICGATLHQPFTTTAATYGNPVFCTLQAPSAGTVLILASANQYLVDEEVEANYRVGEAGVTALATSDRFIDVWANPNDGSDVAVTSMAALPVAAGQTVDVGLMVKRSRGTGTVGLREASVVGLFLPRVGGPAWCAEFKDAVEWGGGLRASCAFSTPQASSALLVSDLSIGRFYHEYSDMGFEIRTSVAPALSPGSEFRLVRTSHVSDAAVAGYDAINQSVPASTIAPAPRGNGVVNVWVEPDLRSMQDFTETDSAVLLIVLPQLNLP